MYNYYDREDMIVPSSASTYFEYYQIKQGDNLYQIAKRYNTNPDLLANINGLNDSDYIYPNQAKERLELLKGKGINYGDEDTFILDYPDYETFAQRFKE